MDQLLIERGYRWCCDGAGGCADTDASPPRGGWGKGDWPAGTSRFNTRIDWILIPPSSASAVIALASREMEQGRSAPDDLLDEGESNENVYYSLDFEEESYAVIDAMDVTDHNMVISSVVITRLVKNSIVW